MALCRQWRGLSPGPLAELPEDGGGRLHKVLVMGARLLAEGPRDGGGGTPQTPIYISRERDL